MFATEFDARKLQARLSAAERRHFPFALVGAINITAFDTRRAWGELILREFDRPTRLTQTAVLYKKATKQTLTAIVFIKDNIGQGTPPSEYLKPQEFAGPRKQKPFERRLQRHPRARPYYVPGAGADLDAHGNIKPQQLQRISSQLQVAEQFAGSTQNESAVGRARRLRRQRRKGGGGSFFILAQRRGKLKAGTVYERIADAGPEGEATSHVRPVLIPVNYAPRYRPRFKAIPTARRLFHEQFPRNFRRQLTRALATAR